MRIFGIAEDSVVDGPGLRYSIFTQGCPHGCIGCHNPNSHDPNGGRLVMTDELISEIKKNPLIDGVTFSGGEPLIQIEAITELAETVKKLGLNTILYTGFLWEEIATDKKYDKLFRYIDILVDGKFKADKKSLDLEFIGSSNQRVIDVAKSLRQNCVVTCGFYFE